MPDYQRFFIDKTPQSFGDALLLHGFAQLLENIDDTTSITLSDYGAYFAIEVSTPISVAQIERKATDVQLVRYIKPEEKEPKEGEKKKEKKKIELPTDLNPVNYKDEKERASLYLASRKHGGNAEKPRPEWSIYRAINPGAIQGYNNLALAWHIARSPETLYLLFDLFSTKPNDINGAISAWKALNKAKGWGIKASATALQLFNPDSGKGHNKVKGDGLSIGNLDSFWLIEYLKAAGFYAGAITQTLRDSKDRKTLVVMPRKLTFSQSQAIMGEFAQSMQVPLYPTQFDILAVIRYLKALVPRVMPDESESDDLLDDINLSDEVVAGFQSAFYKDMGNSAATMNMSFLGLPRWVEVGSQEQVELHTKILIEFEKFVRQFNEKESDVPELLRPLRDFVSGDDLEAFFEFTNAFPAYAVGRQERGKYVRLLTTYFIERIIMNQDEAKYQHILESPGFQNIAYAIRQSTITAQYRKKQGDRKYDVRYGLGQELARKSRYPGEFITALTDFLHKYNAENAQVMEVRPAPYRRSVLTTDIEQIIHLIDEYGSEVVANLLIAYGYARLPQQGDFATDETPIEPDESFEGDN